MTRPIIDAGTITLTNGSATVTGSGTAFGGDVSGINAAATPTEVTSGLLIVPGTAPHVAIVQSAQGDTQLTLTANWTGSTVSGASYAIIPLGDVMNISATQQLLRQILNMLELTQGVFAANDGVPDDADGQNGDFILDINPPFTVYYKSGSVWVEKGDISTGEPGPKGDPGSALLRRAVDGFNLNGTTQYLDGLNMSSVPDGKQLTFAATVYFANAAGANEFVFCSSGTFIRLLRLVSGQIIFDAWNFDNSARVLILQTATAVCSDPGMYSFLISADMASPTSARFFVNGESQSLVSNTMTDANLDLSHAEVALGATNAGVLKTTGSIMRLWFDNRYIDFSQQAMIDRFEPEPGVMGYLGEQGELATGSQPLIYVDGPFDTFHINKGSLGNFVVNGTAEAGPVPVIEEYPTAVGTLSNIGTTSGTFTPNFGNSLNFEMTINGNITIDNPTGAKSGMGGAIRIRQDATGGRTLSFGTNWRFPNGGAIPAYSTAASDYNTILFHCIDDTWIQASIASDSI